MTLNYVTIVLQGESQRVQAWNVAPPEIWRAPLWELQHITQSITVRPTQR